ncbi:MAG: hypothetical protein ACFUZC_07425 [Chthoniobacteraceae bacterium]
MSAQEEIKELERQIANLRDRAVMELKVKLVEARNNVVDLESKIAELTGNAPSAQIIQPRKARVRVTIKQIVEAIQGGATNYRTVADKLGCSSSSVAQKIKAEGKKAGIRSKGDKANFVLSVK